MPFSPFPEHARYLDLITQALTICGKVAGRVTRGRAMARFTHVGTAWQAKGATQNLHQMTCPPGHTLLLGAQVILQSQTWDGVSRGTFWLNPARKGDS